MSDGVTGPVQIPKEVFERWYHRMKDFLNPIHARGFGIACHPEDKAMMVDMLEQLGEDDTWPHDEVPPLLASKRVKRGEVRPVDKDTLAVVTMAHVNNSKKGFGRFNGLYLPTGTELHDPWKEN